jgi:hypothetical protein
MCVCPFSLDISLDPSPFPFVSLCLSLCLSLSLSLSQLFTLEDIENLCTDTTRPFDSDELGQVEENVRDLRSLLRRTKAKVSIFLSLSLSPSPPSLSLEHPN